MPNKTILIGMLVALLSGITIGAQATVNSATGRLLGAARAGLLVNFAGGTLSGLILLILLGAQGRAEWSMSRGPVIFAVISGALGILIVTGIAFSLPRTGVAAGVGGMFLGQMTVAVLADALYSMGGSTIPLDLRRIAGLVVMAIAIALLLPRG